MTLVQLRLGLASLGGMALVSLGQVIGDAAAAQRAAWPALVDLPYAPSPSAAAFVTLGYREAAADLLWIRTLTYFGGEEDTAAGLRGLVDAVVALDPGFAKPYEWAPKAIPVVDGGVTQADQRWAADLTERGLLRQPDRWQLLKTAGEIYLLELESDDPAQQAAWRDRGATLLDKAIRMPGAPRNLATLVAHVRSELGQHERAVNDLRELILTTGNAAARQRLIAKLAKLENTDADRLADELAWQRERFERAWRTDHREIPGGMYLLLGRPPPGYIDFESLAAPPSLFADEEPLEPLTDP